jgi:hypothetical protein
MLDPNDDIAYLDIAGLEGHIMSAIRTRNAAALENVLAEDFLYRSPAAPDVGRDIFIQAVLSLPYEILSLVGEGVRAAVFGDTAVVTGVQAATTRRGTGGEEVSRVAFTDVFVRRNERWQLVLAYGVDLPRAAPGA